MALQISFLNSPVMQTLAWALVHFLWQGAFLALAAAAVIRWVAPSARSRYLVGVTSLALMLAAPTATFVWLRSAVPHTPATTNSVAAVETLDALPQHGVAAGLSESTVVPSAMPVLLPIVVVTWLGGVLVLSVRLLGGWIVARRLAIGARRPVDTYVQDLARRVAGRLDLRRLVRVAESSAVAVPIVVGWLKPVVLLPVAALSGLTPNHLEALLAHELAHVRRQDYLVNLLQSVVETLLFYHPAAWWVSARVRVEREHCCDDLAVTVCDRFVYVDALTDLAARTVHPRLALAATDGPLLLRIRRLLESQGDERPAAGWLSIGVVIMLAAGLTPAVLALSRGDEQAAAAPRAAVAPATTVPVAGPSAAPRVAVPASAATTGVAVVAAIPPTPAVPSAAASTASPLSPRSDQGAGTAAEQQARKAPDEARVQELLTQLQRVAALRDRNLVSETDSLAQIAAVERELQKAAVALLRNPPQALDERRQEPERQRLAAMTRQFLEMQLAAARGQLEEVRAKHSVSHPDRVRLENQVSQLEARTEAARLTEKLEGSEVGRLSEAAVSLRDQASTGPASQIAPSATAPVRPGGDVKYPKIVYQVPAEYPAVARAAKIQGNVYIDAIIGIDGHVRDAKMTGGNANLANAALEAVRQWVYEPTLVNGQPIEVQLTVVVTFKLDGATAGSSSLAAPVADPSAQVRAGDVLAIDIAGEDLLPRTYVVNPSGAVRLPLIGLLAVRDMTASQVRETVAKALADRKLAEGRAVTVTLRRPN